MPKEIKTRSSNLAVKSSHTHPYDIKVQKTLSKWKQLEKKVYTNDMEAISAAEALLKYIEAIRSTASHDELQDLYTDLAFTFYKGYLASAKQNKYCIESALYYLRKIPSTKMIVDRIVKCGIAYYLHRSREVEKEDKLKEALKYLFKAYDLAKSYQNFDKMHHICNQISGIYNSRESQALSDSEKARYSSKVIEWAQLAYSYEPNNPATYSWLKKLLQYQFHKTFDSHFSNETDYENLNKSIAALLSHLNNDEDIYEAQLDIAKKHIVLSRKSERNFKLQEFYKRKALEFLEPWFTSNDEAFELYIQQRYYLAKLLNKSEPQHSQKIIEEDLALLNAKEKNFFVLSSIIFHQYLLADLIKDHSDPKFVQWMKETVYLYNRYSNLLEHNSDLRDIIFCVRHLIAAYYCEVGRDALLNSDWRENKKQLLEQLREACHLTLLNLDSKEIYSTNGSRERMENRKLAFARTLIADIEDDYSAFYQSSKQLIELLYVPTAESAKTKIQTLKRNLLELLENLNAPETEGRASLLGRNSVLFKNEEANRTSYTFKKVLKRTIRRKLNFLNAECTNAKRIERLQEDMETSHLSDLGLRDESFDDAMEVQVLSFTNS